MECILYQVVQQTNKFCAYVKGCQVKAIVLDETFWHQYSNFDYIVTPILLVLTTFDDDTLAMDKA